MVTNAFLVFGTGMQFSYGPVWRISKGLMKGNIEL